MLFLLIFLTIPRISATIIENIANPPHGCPNYGLCTDVTYSLYSTLDDVPIYEYECAATTDCVCVNGTTNGTSTCDVVTNLCTSTTCPNSNYTCSMTGINAYNCSCSTGYSGSSCEFDSASACAASPCQNGGTCAESASASSYTCTCSSGYSGTNCEIKNACASMWCANGATCVALFNQSTAFCDCADTWQGIHCDLTTVTISTPSYDKCWHFDNTLLTDYPLKFSDSQMTVEKCQTYARSFTPQYTVLTLCGTWCAVSMEDTDVFNNTAWNSDGGCSATCAGNSSEKCGAYWNRGVTYDVAADVIDPDGCTNTSRCSANLNQGACIDGRSSKPPGYLCACSPWFIGTDCATPKASACDSAPCGDYGTCVLNTQMNTYTCNCTDGYVGNQCQYANPCSPNPCLHGGTCSTNSSGTFTCACLEFYYGTTCDTVNRCVYNNPCVHGNCSTDPDLTSPNYTCTCSYGWNNTNCDTEINYCDPAPCKYNSTCNAFFGGYNCTCLAGLEGDNCETIIDQCKTHTVNGVGPCNTKDSLANCTTGINYFNCSCIINVKMAGTKTRK